MADKFIMTSPGNHLVVYASDTSEDIFKIMLRGKDAIVEIGVVDILHTSFQTNGNRTYIPVLALKDLADTIAILRRQSRYQ
jgi:hypothetical protein